MGGTGQVVVVDALDVVKGRLRAVDVPLHFLDFGGACCPGEVGVVVASHVPPFAQLAEPVNVEVPGERRHARGAKIAGQHIVNELIVVENLESLAVRAPVNVARFPLNDIVQLQRKGQWLGTDRVHLLSIAAERTRESALASAD